jgi:hypothetical protein
VKRALLWLLVGSGGCASPVIPLRYPDSAGARPTAETSASIGVYRTEDARPGWSARSAAREQRMLTAELPITYAHDFESDKNVDEYVREALSWELRARGVRVVDGTRFAAAAGGECHFDLSGALSEVRAELGRGGRRLPRRARRIEGNGSPVQIALGVLRNGELGLVSAVACIPQSGDGVCRESGASGSSSRPQKLRFPRHPSTPRDAGAKGCTRPR